MDFKKTSTQASLLLRDGLNLYYESSIPAKPKALVFLVHGVCEHSGRYDYLTAKLYEASYGVVRFDLRGHGKSEGTRGYVANYLDYVEDLYELITHVTDQNRDLPLYMIGHSMGALISLLFGLKNPDFLKGQIFSGVPAIELPLKSIKLLKLLPTSILSKLGVKNDFAKLVSRDPEVVENYETDPLNLSKQTVGMASQMFLKAPVFVAEHVADYRIPCLILHGGDDRIVTPEASSWLYENIASEDKKILIYPELYHEIFNEPEKEKVIGDLLAWLDERNPAEVKGG